MLLLSQVNDFSGVCLIVFLELFLIPIFHSFVAHNVNNIVFNVSELSHDMFLVTLV